MSIYSLRFSPTGGTKKVMDILTEQLSIDKHIDLADPDANYETYRFSEEDICLIGVPSYGGRVPALALEHMRQMKVRGTLAILVVVFGNRAYDDTLLELKDEAEALGFTTGAAIAAVAEHSIFRQFGTGRPDKEDEKELSSYAQEIGKVIASRENIKGFVVPGNKPYKKYDGVPMKPKADKSCTKCGTCAALCPTGAISKEDPSSAPEEDTCISCMRCIAVCPENARNLNKAVLFAASKALKKACSDRKENELHL